MPWVRIDEDFAQHPKLVKVGPLGMAMQVAALCYCNRNLTDGFVPWGVARALLSWEFLGQQEARSNKPFQIAVVSGIGGDDVSSDFVIRLLLDAEVWEEVDGGYLIHDYDEYQPTRAEVLAEREMRQAAGRKGGLAKALANAKADARQPLEQMPSNTSSKTVAKSYPVPDPDPGEEIDPANRGLGGSIGGSGEERRPGPPAGQPTDQEDMPRDAMPGERQVLYELTRVQGFPRDMPKNLEYIRTLAVDFPKVDLLEEAKRWRAYMLDHPLHKKGNPRLRFRNWCEIATKRFLERAQREPPATPPLEQRRELTPEEQALLEKRRQEVQAALNEFIDGKAAK